MIPHRLLNGENVDKHAAEVVSSALNKVLATAYGEFAPPPHASHFTMPIGGKLVLKGGETLGVKKKKKSKKTKPCGKKNATNLNWKQHKVRICVVLALRLLDLSKI